MVGLFFLGGKGSFWPLNLQAPESVSSLLSLLLSLNLCFFLLLLFVFFVVVLFLPFVSNVVVT